MLSNYLGQPYSQIGIGEIYPIKIKDFEMFSILSSKYLIIGKETIKNRFNKDIPFLLDFYLIEEEDKSFSDIIKLFELTLQKEVTFIKKEDGDYAFRVLDSSNEINKYNFELYREIVMSQNLQFEPYTFEDDMLQEWLELAREARARRSGDIDIESMCQLISICKGINPNELLEYTYYQLIAEYNRISLKDSQLYVMLLRSQGADEPMPNVGKILDLNENPDATLIKKENSKSID